MPWLAVAFADDALRKKLASHCGAGTSVPRLVLLSPSTGRVLDREGRAKVAADANGAAFPWGAVDPSGARFAGGGHSLRSGSSARSGLSS